MSHWQIQTLQGSPERDSADRYLGEQLDEGLPNLTTQMAAQHKISNMTATVQLLQQAQKLCAVDCGILGPPRGVPHLPTRDRATGKHKNDILVSNDGH